MRLATTAYGPATEHPPLVVVHGLFGAARNWSSIAKRLALRRQVVTVDLRNHGESPWSPHHDYEALASDLAETIGDVGGPADVLGHSMGGKAAMVLALSEPDRIRRLIVADIAPVAYGHSQIGYVEAMRGLDLAGISRRSQADTALAERVPEAAVRAFLLQSLALEDGRAEWRLNLEALGAEMPKIMDFPAIEARFPGPALFLTGGNSDYVGAADRDRIRTLFPAAEHVELAGAGHWLHADAPQPFITAVESFLDRGR